MPTTDSATTDNVYAVLLDTNSAIRRFLNNRYGTTNADLAGLLERWKKEFTANDSTRAEVDLRTVRIRGTETS